MGDISVRKLATGGSSTTFVSNETPSGAINGVNTDFVIVSTPTAGTLKVYLNGARQSDTTDYTFAVTTITFLTAPLQGSVILCDYQY